MEMGRINRLRIERSASPGLFLSDEYGEEILLPHRYAPDQWNIGDDIDVFVYRDSDDRPIATTQTPLAQVGEFACLRVVGTSDAGTFLDWGLEKDLLLPHSQQTVHLQPNDMCVVFVLLDDRSGRVAATQKLGPFVDHDTTSLNRGDTVRFEVYGENEVGVQVLVEKRWYGLFYHNELHTSLELGQAGKAWIKALREEGKIDLSLTPVGFTALVQSTDELLQLMQSNDGFLPLHDGSDPDEIRDQTGLSKKAFKKMVGMLWKKGAIRLSDDGIRLVQNTPGTKA